VLSARNLHFGKNQLFWECKEQRACERFPLGLPRCSYGEASTSRASTFETAPAGVRVCGLMRSHRSTPTRYGIALLKRIQTDL
jgi:hypothetical protein